MFRTGSRPRRLARSLAVVALLALAACGSSDDSPTVTDDGSSPTSTTAAPGVTAPVPAVVSVSVRGGTVEGASRQRAGLNQPVTIRVTSDAADEVHVHGYDKKFEVAAGRTGEVTFVANIPGVFEVELERTRKLLFTLEVR